MLKIKTLIRRFIIKNLKLHRPSSFPYITGDYFRSLAQHVLDESINIDPKKVLPNEIIFVRTNYLIYFLKKIYPKIDNNFILITHNEDLSPENQFISYLDDNKIIHWFAENCTVRHSKITPIPIGLYNQYNDGRTQIIKSLDKINKSNKNKLIAYGFSVNKNKERLELKNMLKNI